MIDLSKRGRVIDRVIVYREMSYRDVSSYRYRYRNVIELSKAVIDIELSKLSKRDRVIER